VARLACIIAQAADNHARHAFGRAAGRPDTYWVVAIMQAARRQRAGTAGSWAGDAQQGQQPGGVAGVAAQGGGDVVVAAQAQDADGQGLRRLAMARGALPVRTWEASSAKVTSRMWCNASMPQ